MNLHSRFLYSLLDINGHHFKQSLFLKEFLSICIPDFFKDISKVYVKREENNIDILIKDNKKCIIVENKIKAKDGDRQIQKYIRQARKEYEKDENIAVIYLSLDRKEPHKKSLGNYNIKDTAIVYGNKQIKFVSINYNNQITEWLKRCKKLDINRGLKDVIDQYLDVINILYGDFETKKHRKQLDFIKDHFTNALEIKFDNYLVKEVAYEIINNFIDDLAKGFNKNKKIIAYVLSIYGITTILCLNFIVRIGKMKKIQMTRNLYYFHFCIEIMDFIWKFFRILIWVNRTGEE